MTVKKYLILFGISYPFFILIDYIWFGLLMQQTYKQYLDPITQGLEATMRSRWPAAFSAWALIVFGAIMLVLPLAIHSSLLKSFGWGACYGLVLYGLYNLTNYAIIGQWPLELVFIDTGWGMMLNGLLLILLRWLSSY